MKNDYENIDSRIYNDSGMIREIANDAYNGWHYSIRSIDGCYPCCYIEIPECHPWHLMKYTDIEKDLTDRNKTLKVHGGLSYSGGLEAMFEWWIGWDYAHYGDYANFKGRKLYTGKVYTLESLLRDVRDVIDQLNDIFKESNYGN